MKHFLALAASLACLWAAPAVHAQTANAVTVTSCGSQNNPAGYPYPLTQDLTGKLCDGASGGGSSSAPYLQTPRGYQQASVTTATGFTPPTSAAFCYISTETAAIRYRTDGTNPTASVGMPLAIGQQLFLSITSLAAFKMIAQTGTATVDIDCYS